MAEEEETTGLVGWLWDKVSNFFVLMFSSVWAGFLDMAALIPSVLGNAVSKWWKTTTADPLYKKIDNLIPTGILDRNNAEALKALIKSTDWAAPIFGTIIYLALMIRYMMTHIQASSGELIQTLNTIYTPNPPGPGEVIQAAFIAPEKTGEVRNAMRRSGLSDADIDLLFISAYRLYDPQTIRDAYFRGTLTEDEMFMRMRELGFTDTRIKEIVSTWELIPGVQDILMMYAKEAFEPDIIEKTGLDQEFPEEGVQWGQKQGLSREWMMKYWYAHWDYPSLQEGFDMRRRGLIDDGELDMLHRIVETPKFWRDKLQGISFNPYTRVDIRRMHQMGVLTDDELVENYRWAGYDQAHAEKLAQFTIKYNGSDRKDLVVSQLLKGYTDKILSREDAKALVMQTGYSDDETEFLLALQDYIDEKSVQDDILAAIKGYYTNNLIERKDAEDRLNKLNLPATKIQSLLERWEISRIKDQKIPSKTDLDKFFRNKIIDEDKYRYEMTKLGYGWVYTDWYLQLIKKGKAG
jgi:hypothetical protein